MSLTLEIDVIIEAIAVEDHSTRRNEESMFSPKDVLDICGSLVELRTAGAGKSVLQLSHHIIKEYVRIAEGATTSSQCRITALDANAEITRVCSRYLTFNAFRAGPCYPYDPNMSSPFQGEITTQAFAI